MLDFGNLKAEIIKKYIEHKNHLGKIDFWSNIKQPNYFTFRTSQTFFRYLKGSEDIKVIDERVSSGKMSILVEIPEVKLDDFMLDRIEVLQDIEFKREDLEFISSNFTINENFHTKNVFKQKDIQIFDIKSQNKELIIRLNVSNKEHIELVCKY